MGLKILDKPVKKKELRYNGELTDVLECDVGISCHPAERVLEIHPIEPELMIVREIITEVIHELLVRPHPLFSTFLERQHLLMYFLLYTHQLLL